MATQPARACDRPETRGPELRSDLDGLDRTLIGLGIGLGKAVRSPRLLKARRVGAVVGVSRIDEYHDRYALEIQSTARGGGGEFDEEGHVHITSRESKWGWRLRDPPERTPSCTAIFQYTGAGPDWHSCDGASGIDDGSVAAGQSFLLKRRNGRSGGLLVRGEFLRTGTRERRASSCPATRPWLQPRVKGITGSVSGRSAALTSPGAAAHTAGIAFTTRIVVATMPCSL